MSWRGLEGHATRPSIYSDVQTPLEHIKACDNIREGLGLGFAGARNFFGILPGCCSDYRNFALESTYGWNDLL
jgi:hypothetical protein